MKLLDAVMPWRKQIRALRAEVEKLSSEGGRRSFPAAATNRLTTDWRNIGISINSLLQQDLTVLRSRARDLQEGDGHFGKWLTMVKSNVVGDGMTLKNKAADPHQFKGGKIVRGSLDLLANTIIEDAWWEWGKKENCTVGKNLTFQQCEQLAIETWGTDGETLWRHVYGDAAKNRFGYALQAIETDRIDTSRNQNLQNGNTIRNGVERTVDSEVAAFYLFNSDPTDSNGIGKSSSERYDAKQFVHPHLMRRIGQTRGWPIAAAALLNVKMLNGYAEAAVEGARAAASRMAFLTKTGTNQEYVGENAADGGKYMDVEPGLIEELPQGMDVKVVDWNQPNGQYDPFTKACLRGIACALNVSYPSLSSDYESVNFSSGRMARMEETEFWKQLQCWFALEFHTPIFGEWLRQALARSELYVEVAGGNRITLPAAKYKKFNQPNWHGRRWAWVDPQKEINAKESELANLLTSPTRALAEQNLDEDEIIEETAAFLVKAKAKFDSIIPGYLPRWARPDAGQIVNTGDEKAPEPIKKEKKDE
jgi:lambda family phage portal protein